MITLHWVCDMYLLCLHFHFFLMNCVIIRSSVRQLPGPVDFRPRVFTVKSAIVVHVSVWYPTVFRRTCCSASSSRDTNPEVSWSEMEASHEQATSGGVYNAAVSVVKPTFSSGRTPLKRNFKYKKHLFPGLSNFIEGKVKTNRATSWLSTISFASIVKGYKKTVFEWA